MKDNEYGRRYDDIIDLPHHQSDTKPNMSLHDRAAQFSPFSALTGYDDAVRETERLTDIKQELSEETKAELDMKLSFLQYRIKEQPEIEITYFVPDEKKSGGRYVTEFAPIVKIDKLRRVVILQNKAEIPIDEIAGISGEIFKEI